MKLNKTLLVIFILGAALRIAFLWLHPLWYDENYSLIVSRLPLQQMMTANLGDVHPPIWYLMIWCVSHLGTDLPAWLIRIPSAIFSIGSLALYWQIMVRMNIKDPVRSLALLLLAVAPVQIYYAHEARMYALLEFLVLAAWLSILQNKWIYLAIEIAMLMLTQNLGALYAVMLYAAALIHDRHVWKPLTYSMVAAFVLWLPWLPNLLYQMSSIQGRHWIPNLTFGDALFNFAQLFFVAIDNVRIEVTSMVTFFSWILIGTWYMLRNRTLRLESIAVVLILAFGPWLAEAAASVIWQPVMLHRTLLGVTPFLYLIMASPAEIIIRTRVSRMVAAALILPALLAWHFSYMVNPPLDDISSYASIIESHWRTGDAVYHLNDSTLVNLWPYTTVETGSVYKQPDCAMTIGGLTNTTRLAMGFKMQELWTIPADRVWIITMETPFNDPCEMDRIRNILARSIPLQCTTDRLTNVCLYLWEGE